MDKFLIRFVLAFLLANTYDAVPKWKLFPFSYPCQEGLCVPRALYKCPCWHKQYVCKPDLEFSCCEDPNFFPEPGSKNFICRNTTVSPK